MHRESLKHYQTTLKDLTNWQDKTTAYHASTKLEPKEIKQISKEERIEKFKAMMNERYGK